MKKILLIAAIIGAGLLGCLLGRNHFREVTQMVVVDTLNVHDTAFIEKPIIKETRVVETMYVAVHDTIVKNDTTYLALPRESKTYGDDRYTAVVSGYKPSLDRLEIYSENQTVTKYLIPDAKKDDKNFISAGFRIQQFEYLSAPIYLRYERLLHKNIGIYGEILYEIPRQNYGVSVGLEARIGW